MSNLTSDGLQRVRDNTHAAYSENRATVQVWVTTMLALLADYDAMRERVAELEDEDKIVELEEENERLRTRLMAAEEHIAELSDRIAVLEAELAQGDAEPEPVDVAELRDIAQTWTPIADRIRLSNESADHKLSLYADTAFYGDAEFQLPEGYAVCRLTSTPASEAT